MAKGPMSKTDLIQTLADKFDGKITRKDVKGLIEAVAAIGQSELKQNGPLIEGLYASDVAYLQNIYNTINRDPGTPCVECPECHHTFPVDLEGGK